MATPPEVPQNFEIALAELEALVASMEGGQLPLQESHAAAGGVDMMHAYALVRDDLPCMDGDVRRRGKPTCHVAFGEDGGLLAGDALQAHAFATLGASSMRDAGQACALLAQGAGAPGM